MTITVQFGKWLKKTDRNSYGESKKNLLTIKNKGNLKSRDNSKNKKGEANGRKTSHHFQLNINITVAIEKKKGKTTQKERRKNP